ncbi:hypothetical protein A9267_00725 [Shewanella sp. UCD-FRSSP16_17]|uniref:WecB/TagA/CpsF family glycosyltransferase n=1 Tax=unclassified Shewanella TaxID=196818 RepID=UPI0007EEB6B4|nr:WecB/TagA/CpsF family glycosyltransferase [Shewanella sp. UCD-FRSSP16_17]MBQ4889119.1 WecB/TagA/CpsF family glycosyltransferase [Shewanella sp. MMG014]OBT11210.1 hypothetical protein A9267_00725 [Shewanella sp. UCD-FRSSP16_17]
MSSTFKTLAEKLTIYSQPEQAIQSIQNALEAKKTVTVAFANAHGFNLAKQNKDFYQHLLNSDFVLRDGIGVKLLFKNLNMDFGFNLNGTDFIPQLLSHLANKSSQSSTPLKLAIFGTSDEILQSAKPAFEKLGLEVVTVKNGFASAEDYVSLSKSVQADIYLLAMGMPKQEMVAMQLTTELDKGLIICGGAIVDFLGGKVKRAPSFIRNMGLEWLYRLLIEPKRMFKRYVIGNVKFLYSTLHA